MGTVVLLGVIFAAVKVFLIPDAFGTVIIEEEGSVEVVMCRTADCAAVFIAALETRPYCAFYELNHPAIIAALAAQDARVLVDEDNAAKVQGLAVESVPSKGLMHDKFCVIGNTVITGSMNPTINDVERNDNNLVIIVSPTLARRYMQEYEELASRTDSTYVKRPPSPRIVRLGGVEVEQRFCPQESCEAAMLSEIRASRSNVSFMLFTFTSDPVGAAMLDAADRGVDVSGVVENRQSDTYSEHVMLQDAGLDVFNDGNRYTMHHKVIIIDNRTVITGSYNPTASANTRNDENMLIIRDAGTVARYTEEFSRVMAAAR